MNVMENDAEGQDAFANSSDLSTHPVRERTRFGPMSSESRNSRLFCSIGSKTGKLADAGLVLLIAYVACSSVLRAASKYFWSDEIITVGLVRLPSLGEIRGALENSADSQPPPFYMVERLAARLPINELIAFRIPSILAFCCSILCVFLFIKRARGSTCALVCATLPLLSVLFNPYAVEARGYSLMTGFAALAMLSYQRASKKAWCVLLGVSLAAATASHYYGVFAVLPFALAELALILKHRRQRPGVWMALLSSVLPVALFWRLLQIYKGTYGGHFVGRLSALEVVRSYGFMWNLHPLPGIALAVATLIAILIFGFFRRKESPPNSQDGFPLQEHVLALGFIMLPVMMGLAFAVLHAGFLYRYAIPAVLGFPLAASYVLSALDRRLGVAASIVLFASLAVQEAGFRDNYWFPTKVAPRESAARLLKSAGDYDLPIVVSDPNTYLQLAYYASPEANGRMVYVADPPTALEYLGSGNGDRCLLSLRPYLTVHVDEFANFIAIHREFLIYVDGSDIWGWIQTRMLHDGYALDVVAMDNDKRVYLVHRKAKLEDVLRKLGVRAVK
jgi:hypothetical protein